MNGIERSNRQATHLTDLTDAVFPAGEADSQARAAVAEPIRGTAPADASQALRPPALSLTSAGFSSYDSIAAVNTDSKNISLAVDNSEMESRPVNVNARMTQQEKWERRKKIADAIKDVPPEKRHEAIRSAANKYKMSGTRIREACKEFGVDLPRAPYAKAAGKKGGAGTPANQTLTIIRHMIDGLSDTAIAEKFKITRQRANAIRQSARKAKLLKG